jgi:uncharacterized protein YcbX
MAFRGTVAEIWRYPVKSMLGERLNEADVGTKGLDGDRAFGVLDVGRGTVLSAKRERALFTCAARYEGGDLAIRLPDDTTVEPGPALDSALTTLIGRPVKLVAAKAMPAARLQGEIDEPGGEPDEWDAPPGTFFDASPLHFVTTSTLRHFRALYPEGDFDPRRFRANFVIDAAGEGLVEEALIGHALRIGEVGVTVTKSCSRCVMTTHAQGELNRDRGILRTIVRQSSNNLGVRATVSQGGRVHIGDVVELGS